jgi:glycosyltransferase involved in cell wall biosynthesis
LWSIPICEASVWQSSLVAFKGCDLLNGAFHQTLSRNPDWHLLIVGPDQVGLQAALEQRSQTLGIADRITWTGMLKGERKWKVLAASEIFVLPSHQENFGIVVAEALACSVPVLISDQVNIWREIQSENPGFVEPDSRDGTINLFRAWEGLDNGACAAMRISSRLCFEKHFDLDTSSSRFLQLMQNLAQQGRHADPLVRYSDTSATP